MIILKRVTNKIYVYPIGKAKGALNTHRQPQFVGSFTIDENKLHIKHFTVNKNGKNFELNKEKLIDLLNKQNILLTEDDLTLKRFLERYNLKSKTVSVCDNCIYDDIITILTKKSTVIYDDKKLCEDCFDKEIKRHLEVNGYKKESYKLFKKIYEKTQDINLVFELIEEGYDPVDNEELTIYDTLEVDEEDYEKVSINSLNIPKLFKSILNKKIEYLLPVQLLSVKEGLLEDTNQLVVSATASGKTLIAELAGIPKALNKEKFIYLSPQVSLANQKYRDFKEKYSKMGLNVVIRVGSNRIKAKEEITIEDESVENSDIIVATYESLDFILRSGEADSLGDVGCVVIDEIHMLENIERGSRLNGLIKRFMTLFPDSQLIGLSATIKNPQELADEFNMKLVEYKNRPVSIERHLVFAENYVEKNNLITSLCKKEFNRVSSKGFKGQTIIFTDSRRKTEQIAKNLTKEGVSAAVYHAGLTYAKKIDIEVKYLNQEISTVVTTAALAAGVDFPASQVIFESLRMGNKWLSSNEFYQMIGRAGRPSYHDIGRVYLLPIVGQSFDMKSEDAIAFELLESSVDAINVSFSKDDVYEQVLSDISAIDEYDINELERKYESFNIPLKFSQAIDELYNCEMIEFNPQDNYYEITDYGRAVSMSFLKTHEAEYIKNNFFSDIIDVVCHLQPITNIYLGNKMINSFKRVAHHNISIRLLSDSTRELITDGYFLNKLPNHHERMLVDLQVEFMKCNCNDKPYCDCLETNISKYIIKRRLDGWDPVDISKEFRKNYEVNIYSGDIYSWLDQIIRYLEAVGRIGKSYSYKKISQDCEDLILKIENKS